MVGNCATDGVVCPKPRKIGANEPVPSRSLHINNEHGEQYDSKAGTELLDIIRKKGNYGPRTSNFLPASSPPLFVGSPPTRASNPIIEDEQFVYDSGNPLSPMHRVNYGAKPAQVRIEGFNCHGNSSISAVA